MPLIGRRARLHDAGLEVGRGEEDEHRVDVREAAAGDALVLDAVLGADDGDVRAGGGAEVVERGGGVLRLHREDDDVVGRPRDLGRMADGVDLRVSWMLRRVSNREAVARGSRRGAGRGR